MNDPATVLDFDEDDSIIEDRERFRIEDDSQAAWAMRKLLSYRSKIAENDAIADAEHHRIEMWQQSVNAKFDHDVQYFEAILSDYARRQRDQGRKSVDTPYGVVKTRATQDKFKVTDEEAFFKWAADNLPDAIAIKRSPSLSELKKHVTVEQTDTLGPVAITEHGEIIPGVVVEPASVSVTVEVTK